MAPSQLPASLKTVDIARFAQRAGQLETAKPAIAYWCEYWIVNQLLARGLHNTDAECLQYTTMLMDKLEQTKTKYADDDAIVDDTAGQAYVEQFGLETFERADRAVQANKVTKQTADTFLAASTFLELLNIWGELDPEIHAKIRYAKWNAVRIVKALKDGTDPNESNPKQEPAVEEQLQPLDPHDPEVQALGGFAKDRQPSVVEVPDEQDQVESRLAAQSTLDHSLHPSAEPSRRPSPGISASDPYSQTDSAMDTEVSPLEPTPNERAGSVGGGYFPEVPTFTSDVAPPTVLTAPGDGIDPSFNLPDTPIPPPRRAPHNFDSLPPKDFEETSPPKSPLNSDTKESLDAIQKFPPKGYSVSPPAHTPSPPNMYRPAPVPRDYPAIQRNISQTEGQNPGPTSMEGKVPLRYNTDDVAVAKAQKHARWAISALNFEDADTAVKELKAALQTLGAL